MREVVQNAFDAPGASRIDISLEKTGRETVIGIEDDGDGFANPALAYTVFLSGKHDDPTKRGRKGRGLKEAIAACIQAKIEVIGKTLTFESKGRSRTRRTAKNVRTRGTRIELRVRHWKADDVAKTIQSIQRFEPPGGVEVTLNGHRIEPHEQVETVPARLQTIVIEDEVERKRTRDTEVLLLVPRPGETPYIHEMGIPVCPVDTPYHLDIQQRIPLPDHRTTVPQSWLRKLRVQVLNHMAERMGRTDLQQDWVTSVLSHASEPVQEHYTNKVFGDRDRLAIRTTADRDANVIAEEDLGLNVIDTRHLPKSVRDILRSNVPSTRKLVSDAKERDFQIPTVYEPLTETEDEQAVCRLAAWFAREVTGRTVKSVIDWEVAILGRQVLACWSPGLNAIVFSRKKCGKRFFADPLQPVVLAVIIHEVAHIVDGHYGHRPRFFSAMEDVAGKVAHLMVTRGDEVRRVLDRPSDAPLRAWG